MTNWYDVRAALVKYRPQGGELRGLFDAAIQLCERAALGDTVEAAERERLKGVLSDWCGGIGTDYHVNEEFIDLLLGEIQSAEQRGYERGRGELDRWVFRIKTLERRLATISLIAEGKA